MFDFRKVKTNTNTKDPTARFHNNNQLSMEAYLSVEHSTSQIRSRIVAHIKKLGLAGATSDEVEQALELSHQTVSARCTEAKAKGELIDSGQRRKTRSGRNAAVLVSL